MYQKIRKSVSANSVNQQKKSQFAPPSFKVQAKPYYPTNEKPGNQSEDLTVQGKEQNVSNPPEVKSGGSFADIPTLRPEIQERSSNEELSWVQRVFKAARTQNYPVNPYQAKLTIGQPGDKYEQEADRVANLIVRQINTPPTQSNHQQSLQRQEIKEQREKLGIQGRLAVGGREASQDLSSAINSARGRGQSLDAGLQQLMGQAMGADFSRVKIHTDAKSDQLNESIQAKAFTTGHDVFFRRGAYEPGSRGGQELIAHELTHVVQQNGNNIQAKPDTSTIQRAFVKERIKFFESLGVKNKSKGGIPLGAKDISPDTAPTEEEGSNPSVSHVLNEEKESNSNVSYITKDEGNNSNVSYITEDEGNNSNVSYITEDEGNNSNVSYITKDEGNNSNVSYITKDEGNNSNVSYITENEGNNSNVSYITEDEGNNSNVSYITEDEGNNSNVSYITEDEGSNSNVSYITEDEGSNSSGSYITEDEGSNSSGSHGHDNDIISSLRRGENDNYEAPKKYRKVKEINSRYKGEDKDSRETTHVNDIFKMQERAVTDREVASVAEGLKKFFGWSDEDVAKYYDNKEQPKVKYLDKESRKDYELIGGSTLRQGEPPILFDTSEMFSAHSGKGFGIYVMSPDGKLYSHAHKVGLFHHSSFLAGLPTAGAGEIKVIGGKVQHITNKSGHYHPDQKNMVQTLQEFKSRGVNLAGVKLTLMDGEKFGTAQEFLDKKERLVK